MEAVYRLPFLDHATMEPMTCTARVRDGGVEVWAPTQSVTAAQQAAARVAGVEPGAVVLHAVPFGGGFGRRLALDYVVEAVEIARRVDAPVQLHWTREDTTRHGSYRPLTYHELRAGLGRDGLPVAWTHRLVGTNSPGLVVGGADNIAYSVPNQRIDFHVEEWGVPVGAWRSVSYTHNGFVVESFVDELAAAAGRDPVEYRLALMGGAPKLRRVLELAAEKAGWGSALPAGRFRGVAAVSSFASHAAEVAEVSVDDRGRVRVHRVVCALDVGQVINPSLLAAQVEGAVALALSYTLHHRITLQGGRVREGNFTDYPLLRLDEMPEVEVYTLPSTAAPTGVGEPPVPPLAPAVANAVFAATGTRVRELPIEL